MSSDTELLERALRELDEFARDPHRDRLLEKFKCTDRIDGNLAWVPAPMAGEELQVAALQPVVRHGQTAPALHRGRHRFIGQRQSNAVRAG